MARSRRRRYDLYARQRIIRKLLDLQATEQGLDWSGMADAISAWREVPFQRNNFYRLLKGKLQDANINLIVDWIEAFYDPDFREKLKPASIFREVGVSARDYYFHLPFHNDLFEWEEQVLDDYAGVYLCAPSEDTNSYTPLPIVRRWFRDRDDVSPGLSTEGRTVDITQYIVERTILILQRTSEHYFHAAEFPMSLLFPKGFTTNDLFMVYEGVAIAASNSIHVFMRECLSRIPKTHCIVIYPKGQGHQQNPYGLTMHVGGFHRERMHKDWALMSEEDLAHLRRQYASTLESDFYMSGFASVSTSPIPYLRNYIHYNFSRDYEYHKMPADFLRDKEQHFIRPDFDIDPQIEKIIQNPLTIGELK